MSTVNEEKEKEKQRNDEVIPVWEAIARESEKKQPSECVVRVSVERARVWVHVYSLFNRVVVVVVVALVFYWFVVAIGLLLIILLLLLSLLLIGLLLLILSGCYC